MALVSSPVRNLLNGVAFIGFVVSIGVIGYMLAGWSFEDALYMVVITIFSVGYREVQPVDSLALRMLTMTLILLGCTGMIFLTGALVQALTVNEIQQFFGIKRMKSEIDHLRNHVVICGYGRIGSMVARDLSASHMKFVLIDSSEANLEEARQKGFLCLHGDATDESILRAAGIDRAAVLATVLPDDAANVFITLSARGLNTRLRIIARGEQPSTENKLVRAGADRVVLPAHIGAERIAEIILFPEVAQMLRAGPPKAIEESLNQLGLELEVLATGDISSFIHKTVDEIEAMVAGAFLIIAVRRRDGSSVARPKGDFRIESGDGIVVLGRTAKIAALAEAALK